MIKLVNRFPIVSSVLLFVLTMVIPWGLLYPLLSYLPHYYGYAIKYMLTFLLTLIFIFAIYKKFPYSLSNKRYFKGLITFGLVGLVCAIVAFFCSMQEFDRTTNPNEVISFVLYIIAIVLSEELLFRGLILGAILNKYGTNKKMVLFSILIASIIFGLRHYLNLIDKPNTIISTTGQVLFTFMAGFYLSCVYIRTKNPYIGCSIHLLEDLFTMCWLLFSISFVANQNVDGDLLSTSLLVLVHIIYVFAGILMIMDKKYVYESIMVG